MGLLGSVTVVTGSNRTHHEPPRTGTHHHPQKGVTNMLYRLTIRLRWRVLIVAVAAVAAATALPAQASAANHTHRHRTHHNAAFATGAQATPATPDRPPGWGS